MEWNALLYGYQKGAISFAHSAPLPLDGTGREAPLGPGCSLAYTAKRTGTCLRGQVQFTFSRPSALPCKVALRLCLSGPDDFSSVPYVFMPGAVYDGNRFDCQKLPYPPFARVAPGCALTAGPVIADIPRLSADGTPGEISLRSGDMTTPAVGCYDRAQKSGALLFTAHQIHGDYTGLLAGERPAEKTLALEISVPAVREKTKYFFGDRPQGGFYPDSAAPSGDTGRWFSAGETVTLPFVLELFSAPDLPGFLGYFNRHRCCLEGGNPACAVPFGTAYRAVKEKTVRSNYITEKNGGYLAVGTERAVPQQHWQAGWVGGGMNGYPFLLEDAALAKEQALATFRFIFDRLQHPHGWVWGMYADGVMYSDAFGHGLPGGTLLLRKNADLLYFVLKQYAAEPTLLASYAPAIRRLGGAFVRLFQKYGQLGQFIDLETDEMIIGNTASAASACAALALGHTIFGDAAWLETAEALGELYRQEYLEKGYTNGGPGEICQAPDSESAFGLLEGYVELYEATRAPRWLDCARRAAELAQTWVMSYPFAFPPDSTAARRGVNTLGTVFANAQNKHSAPGICTLSGNSLLKLYRATGDPAYLALLHGIATALMQSVSLPERPVWTLQKRYLADGWVNERVQTSDWEGSETVGEYLYGSNWPEVCVLLSYVELPGVYLDLGRGKAFALDSLRCSAPEKIGDTLRLTLHNPTAYDTVATVLVDNPADFTPLGHNYFKRMQKIPLAAGEGKTLSFPCASPAAGKR